MTLFHDSPNPNYIITMISVARAAKSFGMCVWGLGSQEGSPRVPCNHVDEYRWEINPT